MDYTHAKTLKKIKHYPCFLRLLFFFFFLNFYLVVFVDPHAAMRFSIENTLSLSMYRSVVLLVKNAIHKRRLNYGDGYTRMLVSTAIAVDWCTRLNARNKLEKLYEECKRCIDDTDRRSWRFTTADYLFSDLVQSGEQPLHGQRKETLVLFYSQKKRTTFDVYFVQTQWRIKRMRHVRDASKWSLHVMDKL
jgi:hypothetical protein